MHDLSPTRFFYQLTPEAVLTAVEDCGVRCTGRVLQLNSLENRVYEAEIETQAALDYQSRFEAYRVVKFYRPGRWTREQIAEEHRFLFDLQANDIPVVAPLRFPADEDTIHELPGQGIFYTVFPKFGGRTLDELNREQLERMGRTIARLHLAGQSRRAEHRLPLSAESYGRSSAEYLLGSGLLPAEIGERYAGLTKAICDAADEKLGGVPVQRVHGDLHCGNVLWHDDRCALVDFDDMVVGPCVQDLWLIVPGRDEDARRRREELLRGYEQMREFDYGQLQLVEALRALRIMRFSAWIARRWEDPAFPAVFPDFGSPRYWREHLAGLEEQLCLLRGGSWD